MSFWSKIKNKLNINRKFMGGTLYIDGKAVGLESFKFIENTHHIHHPYSDSFQLLCDVDFTFEWKENSKFKRSTVSCPFGFIWDGASIPESLQWLIGGRKDPEFALASCIHDKAVDSGLSHYPESRIFYEVLKTRSGSMKIPKWKSVSMYAAVFAWSVYTS